MVIDNAVTQKAVAQKKDSGFTLIEMIVVIIILGILAGIAVIGVTSANRSGLVAACKADFESVDAALKTYKNDRTETLTNTFVGYGTSSEFGTGDSLISLEYMVPLISNGTYRIYLTTGGGAVGVQGTDGAGGWTVLTSTNVAKPELACNAITGTAGNSEG